MPTIGAPPARRPRTPQEMTMTRLADAKDTPATPEDSTRARIAKVIAEQTGQPLDKVAQDIERDFWMNAEEATAYGIVSRVIQTQVELTQLQG